MNRLLTISLASLAASFAVASLSSTARADDSTTAVTSPTTAPASAPATPPTVTTTSAQQDRATDSDPVKSFKSFAIEVNPLAAAAGRYSAQVEWLPAVHNAIVVNPHFDHIAPTIPVADGASYTESFTGFGSELGYRYYTGTKGANGFFVGPSVLVAHYSTSVEGGPSQSFNTIGGAIDIGGQAVIGPGIIVGGGFGLQYTKSSLNGSTDGLPLLATAIAGDGVRPRFLLTVGYAF
jgi:hypothetical protein